MVNNDVDYIFEKKRETKVMMYDACPKSIIALKQEMNRFRYGYSPYNAPNRNCAGWACLVLRDAASYKDPSNPPASKLYAPAGTTCESSGLMPYHFVPRGENIPPITSDEEFRHLSKSLIRQLLH